MLRPTTAYGAGRRSRLAYGTRGRFPPPDVAPPSARSAEADDGRWKPFDDAQLSDGKSLVYTTVIHPHEASRFIALTVVAIDLARARLEFLPGVDDVSKQRVPFAPGLVPASDGRWGMRVGDSTLLPPREPGCTIALFAEGRVEISSWPALAPAAAEIRALRQTPPCLLEQGAVHADLVAGRDKAWAGHTPGIVTRRRSAIGLSQDAQTLFYAIGVETSPKLLASGLRAVGAATAAQLDINWNWTRFLLFGTAADGKPSVAKALVQVEYSKRDYVELASKRDFFYVVKRH